ncbi:Por secretion system C-terminal sorting domain-containing protein [Catalinimonas alkaloidigena]|uniref:Por secretion system C-terminal sorting domain-containing protein n=1 Tax=Catalinimonas alkaloidigena TaxID=1075417 RepID=A0A1G9GS16_9BACT|nr:T9SS type A sorting domain-containing protein [Catalinimonas alkaloidigena]SDL03486.1 Por secretion system C-terminal sorting domain-containing protein [Catalinimonas alkaloidigena]
MKKRYFPLLFLLLCYGTTHAQLTLTQDDHFQSGQLRTDVLLSSETFVLPDSGSQQLWDYSSLTGGMLSNTSILEPAQTPYAAQYPGTTYALAAGSSTGIFGVESFLADMDGYVYLSSTEAGIQADGVVLKRGGEALKFPFEPALVLFPTPLRYEDAGLDTAFISVSFDTTLTLPNTTLSFQGTVTIDSYIYTDWKALSEGLLATPLDIYETLLLRSIRTVYNEVSFTYDVFMVPTTLPISQYTSPADTSYSWLTNAEPFLVMTASPDSGTTELSYFVSNEVITDAPSLLATASVRAYPNPANQQLTLDAARLVSPPTYLHVYDMTGRLQHSYPMAQRQLTVDTRSYASGAYFYTLETRDGTHQRGRFVVTH